MAKADQDNPQDAAAARRFRAPETTLTDYVRVVSTRRWLVGCVFLMTVLLAGIWVFTRTPLYRSTALLQIEPGTPSVTPFQPVLDGGSYASVPRRDFIETQMQLIASERLVADTIKRFGIHKLPRFKDTKDLVARLKESFAVEPIRRTWLVEVAFYWPDPKLGAQILDYHVTQYVESYANRQLETGTKALENLLREKEEVFPRVEEARRRLQEFRQEHNITSFDRTYNTIADDLMAQQKAASEARQALSASKTRLDEVEKAIKNQSTAESLPDVLDSQLIRDYRNQKALCEQNLREGLKRFGEQHPEIKAYRAKLESIDENIRIEIARIVDSVRTQHSQAEKLLERRQEELAEQQQKVQQFNELKLTYDALKTAFDAQDVTYTAVLTRIHEIEIANAANVRDGTIRIERRPKEETTAAKPRKLLVLALASLMGLALGIGLAFLLDTLDTTLKSKEHVSRYLGLSLLGYVPALPELVKSARHHTHFALAVGLHPRSAVAEAFRSIRTALSFSVAAQEVRHIMVTSASPSEGKTLVAVNIAAAIAQTGKKVLLVDADMRKPAIHKIMEADQTPGLTNLLVGEGANCIEDVVRPTDVPNLFYIPCGPAPPNPAELMGCERMKVLLAKMVELYDRVILDTPPVVNVTDAAVLCNEAHGVVFVVRGFRTQREIARRALEILAHSNAQLLGAVLNNVDVPRGAYYYDTYYQYQQYYYYAEDGTKRKRSKKQRKRRGADSHKATA
ncbi:MAG: polysaccharide biosynthesis tyrosine autokinase [Planctomycetota bacterium]